MNTNIKILQPDFYSDFSCIGPACSDNCCHTWSIEVDKAHYLQYVKEKNPSIRASCKATLQRNNHASNSCYATLRLDAHGRCGFQDPDGGCKIYREMGSDSLCVTCAVYPRRRTQFFSNTWELSLSMSCMEAARLCLLRQNPIQFQLKEISPKMQNSLLTIPLTGIGKNGSVVPNPPYSPILRQICLELMSLRHNTIPERILSIGIFLRHIGQLLRTSSDHQISEFSMQYYNSVKSGEFHGFLNRLDYSSHAHLAALQFPLSHLLAGSQLPILQCLMKILTPWCSQHPITGQYQISEKALSYMLELIQKYSDPYLSAHAQTIENYFISFLYSSLFPFRYLSEGLTWEQNGILLAEQYALLRILLALFAEKDSCCEDSQLIQAVVSLSRSSQHTDLGQDIIRLIQATRLDGLAHAIYFLI